MQQLEQYITDGDLPGLNNLLTQTPALATRLTSHKVSPLMLSCYYKKPEVSQLLLKYVEEIDLFEASAVGKFDVVAHLILTTPTR
jgi:ubiquinone biosynthesis protein UbiJ